MKYAWITLRHKWWVLIAGLKLGGIPIWRLLVHDLSKFSPAEIHGYNRWFCGDKSDVDGFNAAWLHHQNHNPHHWEFWISRTPHVLTGSTQINVALPMPKTYVREMVADWLGASRIYTGSWEMSAWLGKNIPRILDRMHQESARYACEVLAEIGYEIGPEGYPTQGSIKWSK